MLLCDWDLHQCGRSTTPGLPPRPRWSRPPRRTSARRGCQPRSCRGLWPASALAWLSATSWAWAPGAAWPRCWTEDPELLIRRDRLLLLSAGLCWPMGSSCQSYKEGKTDLLIPEAWKARYLPLHLTPFYKGAFCVQVENGWAAFINCYSTTFFFFWKRKNQRPEDSARAKVLILTPGSSQNAPFCVGLRVMTGSGLEDAHLPPARPPVWLVLSPLRPGSPQRGARTCPSTTGERHPRLSTLWSLLPVTWMTLAQAPSISLPAQHTGVSELGLAI